MTALAGTEAARIRLASAGDTPPELLFFMANDSSIAVRTSVAMNDATPPRVHRQLTHDPDERVRRELARKLATLTPGLFDGDQARLSQHAWNNLSILVQDTADQVRALVAELVSSMPDAPRALILALARDTAIPVGEPILRLSPVLTQEDLLALLVCPPTAQAASSIAQRTDLTEAVSDAIAHSADTIAIARLLGNPSAAIRESTLDSLVNRSAETPAWHAPLVRRPGLSPRNARLLATIVAEHLVEVLAQRPDLEPSLVHELRDGLQRRLAPTPPTDPAMQHNLRFAEAQELKAAGRLNESALVECLRQGDIDRLGAMLAVAAGVSMQAVQRAMKLHSAKAVVSLVWKAGFSMRLAGPVQSLLCSLPPVNILRAPPGGGFPLSEEEMRWQLEFVTHR